MDMVGARLFGACCASGTELSSLTATLHVGVVFKPAISHCGYQACQCRYTYGLMESQVAKQDNQTKPTPPMERTLLLLLHASTCRNPK